MLDFSGKGFRIRSNRTTVICSKCTKSFWRCGRTTWSNFTSLSTSSGHHQSLKWCLSWRARFKHRMCNSSANRTLPSSRMSSLTWQTITRQRWSTMNVVVSSGPSRMAHIHDWSSQRSRHRTKAHHSMLKINSRNSHASFLFLKTKLAVIIN